MQLISGKELEKDKSEEDEGNKKGGSLENAESLEKERKKEHKQEEEKNKKMPRTLCL